MGSLLTFATSNLSFDSAAPRDILENNRSLDLIQFLSIAQHTKTDFLPITWAPFEELAGRGGSAQISQSQINIQTSFAFKRFSEPRSDGAELVFKALASEIRVLQNPHTRSSPHVVNLQGICWEFDDPSGTIYPVLVFPKAEYGDLYTYLRRQDGKAVSFDTRLKWCIQIARAINTLHTESIKPT